MMSLTSLLKKWALTQKHLHCLYALLVPFLLSVYVTASPNTHLQVQSNFSQINTQTKQIMLLASLKLQDGWYTYWDNPGDSGLPLTVTLKNPNVKQNNPLVLPIPKEFSDHQLVSFGYKNGLEFGIPLNLYLEKNQKRLLIEGELSGLICKDVCIPFNTPFSLHLPIAKQEKLNPNVLTTLKNISLNQKSKKILQADFQAKGIRLYFEKGHQTLRVLPKHETIDLNARAYNPNTGEIWLPFSQKTDLSSLEGFIKTENKTLAFVAKKAQKSISLFSLALAFLGGLILNIMPCVLPVLSLKIMSLPKTGTLRAYFGYQLGILLSFLILTLILEGFKQLGVQLGWGFQLQSPLFICSLIVLFSLLGLNMLGLFEMGLIFTRLARFQKPNQHVLSGMLMTLVATPCSAPFVGSSVALALSSSMINSFLMFSALAFGLGFPFLLFSFIPNTFRTHLKPGPWSLYLKQTLSLGLFGTSIWLLYILQQLQFNLSISLSLLLIIITLFIYAKHQNKNKLQHIIIVLFLLIGLLSYWVNTLMFSTTKTVWEDFNSKTIRVYEQTNQAYFIDFTALWCLTCQTNKINVLNDTNWQASMKDNNIKLIQADWTNRNSEITQALKRYNRISVPTYVYYDGINKPVLLPDLLTKSIIKKHIPLTRKTLK